MAELEARAGVILTMARARLRVLAEPWRLPTDSYDIAGGNDLPCFTHRLFIYCYPGARYSTLARLILGTLSEPLPLEYDGINALDRVAL